jgi:hypothetical protein
MHLRLRAVLAVVGVVLLVTMFMPRGAQAQEDPSITVTPSTGLEDGDTVMVTGGRFPTLVAPVVAQCVEPVVLTDVLSVVSHCQFSHEPSFDAEGNLVPTTLIVHEVITQQGGPSPGGATFDCTVSDCSVAVFGFLTDVTTLVGAKTPISFGPDVPETRADCQLGGWRDLANDQGQPFANPGLCVAYVVARRP